VDNPTGPFIRFSRAVSVGLFAILSAIPFARAFQQDPEDKTQRELLSPVERAERDGSAARLSLKELTKIALQNNLDIAISDTNEVLYQQRLIQAFGPYDPALTINLGTSSSKSPNTNIATASSGASFNSFDRAFWNVQLAQNIPTGGGFSYSYNTGRSDTNQAFALFTPQYNASQSIQFIQPLRRNFRTDQIRSNIKLVNLDLKINDSQFRKNVTDTIARIQAQYWDLVAAIRDYDIQRESVRLAETQLENNKMKVKVGTLATIGITEARAEVSAREVELFQAEERINTVENNLRALISSDRNADIWRQTIIPTDKADFKEVQITLDKAIDTALGNRPELEQIRARVEQSDINYDLEQNLKKWQFDFVASFGTVGVAGPQTFDENGQPRISPEFVGSLTTAYKTVFSQGLTNWFVGFNVQIPLRNRTQDAMMAQIKVQKQQLLMGLKQVEQQIIVEVRNAVQALETNKKRVETARIARDLAEQQLDGESKRFQAGLSENFRVLDRQRQVSQQQGVELQTLIAYKKSMIDLQRAMYNLLEANEFEIAKSTSQATSNKN
jgi:outer membrane protein TolC